MSFIKKTIGTFGTQLGMILLGLANNALVANVLGAEGQGSFALYLLVPMLMVQLGNFGVGMANTYFLGSRKLALRDLASQSLLLAIALGSLLIVGFWGFRTFVGMMFDPNLILVIWVVPFSMLTLFIAYLILGLNQIKNYNLTLAFPKLNLFIGLILFLFVFQMGTAGTAWAYLVAEISAAIAIFSWFSMRILKASLKFKPDFTVIKKVITFGMQGFIANVLSFLNYRLDMFLILYFLNRQELGYYSIAVLLVEKIWLIPNAIGTVLFPQVASGNQREMTPLVCRNSLLITGIVALGLFIFAPLIIGMIFIDEFQASVLPLQILLPGIVLIGIPKVLSADLAGRGKPIFASISAGVTVMVNTGLNLVLIPRYGISGAALASTISYSLSAICILYFYIRLTKVRISEVLIFRKTDFHHYRAFLNRFKNRKPAL